jgi:hypothetical protein
MEDQSHAMLHQGEIDSALIDGSACREYATVVALVEKSQLGAVTVVAAVSSSLEARPVVTTESRSTIYTSPPGASLFRVPEAALRI